MGSFLGELKKLCRTERFHHIMYSEFAARERDQKVKRLLKGFAEIERRSSDLWLSKLRKYGVKTGPQPLEGLKKKVIILVWRFVGLRFALKALEYGEETTIRNFKFYAGSLKDRKEGGDIIVYLENEQERENRLTEAMFRNDVSLNNIRDKIFGMNDGLVEVLAAVVGLGAFLQKSNLIFLSGLIVAVSGTLSMAGGAYIATDYESKVKGYEETRRASRKSSLYVGSFYIFGSVFPLIPFALGAQNFLGIALAIIITSFVLGLTATFVAIVSDRSISRNVAETLMISLGAAAVTILIGYYARTLLHLNV